VQVVTTLYLSSHDRDVEVAQSINILLLPFTILLFTICYLIESALVLDSATLDSLVPLGF